MLKIKVDSYANLKLWHLSQPIYVNFKKFINSSP